MSQQVFKSSGQIKALDGTSAVQFDCGAVRSSRSPRFDLIPRQGLVRLAHRYELGLKKYSRDNWRKGLSNEEWLDQLKCHMADHMSKYLSNYDVKDDHLAAICWGAFALIEAEYINSTKEQDGPIQD